MDIWKRKPTYCYAGILLLKRQWRIAGPPLQKALKEAFSEDVPIGGVGEEKEFYVICHEGSSECVERGEM